MLYSNSVDFSAYFTLNDTAIAKLVLGNVSGHSSYVVARISHPRDHEVFILPIQVDYALSVQNRCLNRTFLCLVPPRFFKCPAGTTGHIIHRLCKAFSLLACLPQLLTLFQHLIVVALS